jgi:hypothetical protein
VLPGAGRLRRSGVDPGGTSVEERAFPIVPVAAGAIAVGVLLLLLLRGSSGPGRPPAPSADEAGNTAEPVGAVPTAPANTAPPPVPDADAAAGAPPAPPLDIPSPAGPSPDAVAAELERVLGRQRLWSSVQAIGERVDVRSGSCAEPEMGSVIDAARATLGGAGLTRLRCLAQSGAVVFERDL